VSSLIAKQAKYTVSQQNVPTYFFAL